LVTAIVSAHPPAPPITVSVVSHGQRAMVEALVGQLARRRDPLVGEVIVTHNLPDAPLAAPADGWPFGFVEVANERPASFAANHNRAFDRSTGAAFCILNPDIELTDAAIWSQLHAALDREEVGCAYPLLRNADGTPQDNEREAVTPLALVRRYLLRRPQRRTDWVSGAFWLVPAPVWRELGGLDEGFAMYCEDTDFCLRLQLAGWRLQRVAAEARHGAARASRRPGLRMAWHVLSLLRLWTRPPLWRFLGSRSKARQ
jgi:N-acetylglucosaminyl-diphospho-decaprenol L-rhamnosyltransferase